ncbi:uncharacterized protein LODBEIA_P16670 [Lodderomyces beijingensis]|uniref:DUF4045 domain-containing protein n=1 Tax=Lodderomyces beijingensis TaxID=1775926 RepID=A0ABP0ZII2_9ASCO
MTEVKGNQRNEVDEFLSSLSQLSQERLREDRQRQRDLQREIDELKSRSNSTSPAKYHSSSFNSSKPSARYTATAPPDLKFNRSGKVNRLSEQQQQQQEEEDAPKLPRRRQQAEEEKEASPRLPDRKSAAQAKTPPRLPARKYKPDPEEFSVGLFQPAARKPSPPPTVSAVKPTTSRPQVIKGDAELGGNSFSAMERQIKSGSTSKGALWEFDKEQQQHQQKQQIRPTTATKPDWLSSLAAAKNTQSTPQAAKTQNVKISPPKSKRTSWIDSVVSKSPESKSNKSPFPPVKPNKPLQSTLATNEEHKKEKEKEKQKPQLRSLSSSNGKPEPEFLSVFQKLKREEGTDDSTSRKAPPPALKPKPKPSVENAQNAELLEFQNKFNSIGKSKPTVPVKPKAATLDLKHYEDADTAQLRSKLSTMSVGKPSFKPKLKPSAKVEEEHDAAKVLSQLRKVPPSKPEKKPFSANDSNHKKKKDQEKEEADDNQESVSTFASKKAVAPKPPPKMVKRVNAESFVSANDKAKIPAAIDKPVETIMENSSVELSFEQRLGSILSKAKTFPQAETRANFSSPRPQVKHGLPRARTVSGDDKIKESKLEHTTKCRAKGPKRKLPKTLQGAKDGPAAATTTATATRERTRILPSKNLQKETDPTDKTTIEEDESADGFPIVKKSPPIKQKPKTINVKPRVISGDLFI